MHVTTTLAEYLITAITAISVVALHPVYPIVESTSQRTSRSTPTPTPAALDQPPTSTASPTPTASKTPTASPTSFRVADLKLTVNDDTDPVLPGETFQYTLVASNLGPAFATSSYFSAGFNPAAGVRFTGVYSIPGRPDLFCSVPIGGYSANCNTGALGAPVTVNLEAVVDDPMPPGTARMCGSITLSVPMGYDPNPSNNGECEETVIQAHRGDCNADGGADAGDLPAIALEIFDGDGASAAGAPGGSFPGHAIGCDANADATINAGDLACAVKLIFEGSGACQ